MKTDWRQILVDLDFERLYDDSPRVDSAYMVTLCKALNVDQLPEDYASFLVISGGVTMAGVEIVFRAGPMHSSTGVFFGRDPGGTYDLLGNVEDYRERIPATLLAVGMDPGGNLLCLGIHGHDRGKLFYWDHENENADGEPHWKNIYPIAASFAGLFGF